MKNLIKYTPIILLCFVLLASCESEPITDLAKIEKELKTVIKNNAITKCSIITYDSNLNEKAIYTNSDFSIKSGSIVIIALHISGEKYEQRYNLLNLSNYKFANGYIYFYFSMIPRSRGYLSVRWSLEQEKVI